MPSADGHPTEVESSTTGLMEISNAMVKLYKEQFGRGPTKARTYWCSDHIITTVLEDTLTPAEAGLVKLGEHRSLRETRMLFQYASTEDFCETIERVTRRKVRSFVSGIDTHVDGLAVELFVLHPAGYEGPSRAELAGLNSR